MRSNLLKEVFHPPQSPSILAGLGSAQEKAGSNPNKSGPETAAVFACLLSNKKNKENP